jgi:hypothetical protein
VNLNAADKFQNQQKEQADQVNDSRLIEIGALPGISDTLKMNMGTLIDILKTKMNASLFNNVKTCADLAARSLHMAVYLSKILRQKNPMLYENVGFKILDDSLSQLFNYSRKLEQLQSTELSLPKAAEIIFSKPQGQRHYLNYILQVLRGIMILKNYRPVWDEIDMEIKSSLEDVDAFIREMLDILGFDLHRAEVKQSSKRVLDQCVEERDECIIEDDYLKRVLAELYNRHEIDENTIVDVRVLGYDAKKNGAVAEIRGETRKSRICTLSESQLKRNADFHKMRGNK